MTKSCLTLLYPMDFSPPGSSDHCISQSRVWKCLPFPGLPSWLRGKESTYNAGDVGLIPALAGSPGGGRGNPLQHSCLGNPRTEEPGGLQTIGLQRAGHDWSNCTHTCTHFLLQSIFLTQGLNPSLLHWQADSLPLSQQGSPEWYYFLHFTDKETDTTIKIYYSVINIMYGRVIFPKFQRLCCIIYVCMCATCYIYTYKYCRNK